MIFAFATDEQTLCVFPDETFAISYCEGIDVEDGLWLFWNDEGTPLFAKFTIPNQRESRTLTHGVYHLVQYLETSQTSLFETLKYIETVEGQPPLNSVAAIKQYLLSKAPKT